MKRKNGGLLDTNMNSMLLVQNKTIKKISSKYNIESTPHSHTNNDMSEVLDDTHDTLVEKTME